MPNESNNPPEHTIRVGDLELAIWRRDGEFGPMYSGKLQRRYKDENGELQSTLYLGANDFNDAIRAYSEGIDYCNRMKRDFKYQQAVASSKKERPADFKTPAPSPAPEKKRREKTPPAEIREPGQEG